MSLPKLEIPVYEIKLFEQGKKIKYRPYTVKEEKSLLMAMESKDEKQIFETSIRCCDACLVDKRIKVQDLSVLDLETLLIAIRSKSVGENIDLQAKCDECENKLSLSIDITKMRVEENGEPEYELKLNEDYGVRLRSPSLESIYSSILNKTDETTSALLSCIDFVYNDTKTYSFKDYTEEEKVEFIENLSIENVKDINEKFIDKLPSNVIDLSFTCPACKKENEKTVGNLLDFFT